MSLVLFALLGYVAAQLAIGAYVSRRVHTDTDYLLAGRQLSYTLATFSIFATWFGAETCIGAAGAIYKDGLSASSRDPFGYTVCLLVMGLFLARRLWSRGLTTLGDLFRQRYSPGVERLAVLLLVPTSILWAAAQVRAFGLILASASHMNELVATTTAAAVVITYTAMGGLLADAITDLVQGVVLLAGLVVAAVVVFLTLGGPVAVWQSIDASRLSLVAPGAGILDTLNTWAIPICGSVVAQELVSRVLAARSPQVAQRAALGATGIYVTVGLIPVLVGLVGPRLVPGLADPEHILPEVVRQHAGTLFYVLFAGALLSAILSTVDSALLAAGALTSENLVASLNPRLGPTTRLRISRVCVVSAGVVAFLLALNGSSVFDLVEEASAFGSAGIFVVVMFGLFSRFGGVSSAIAALVGGAAVWIGGTYLTPLPLAYLLALATAFILYAAVAVFERLLAPGRGSLRVAVGERAGD